MQDITAEKRKISKDELPKELPVFNSSFEPKEITVKKWLMNWILSSIKNKQIKENDIIPSKFELSEYLGVSSGTVQNAVKHIEDLGLLRSKQKCGTLISNPDKRPGDFFKSTSKRDKAVIAIKRTLIQKNFKKGDIVPSTRRMAEFIGVSQNTIRLAYEYLTSENIFEYKKLPGLNSDRVLKEYPVISPEEMKSLDDLFSDTLVNKISEGIKKFLAENYSVGEKIPSHEEFASRFNVSVKTVHDCISKLSKEGIIITRRGKYGSVLAQNPLNPVFEPLKENSIFAKAEDSVFYSYQKIENQIISIINSEFNSGDKLPSMQQLALRLGVSTNTVRKALINLASDGYVTFGRGRYGGTFVIEKPAESDKQQFKWLSVNPDYI